MDTAGSSPSASLVDPDDAPTRLGAMCGACGSGRYLTSRAVPGRVRCVRCGNARPAAA